MNWYNEQAKAINEEAQNQALAHQNNLTKPIGSLGELENIVVRLAGLQGVVKPSVKRPFVAIFAGDHGVMAERVSAYPQVVTRQMIANFATGGACVSVMARHLGASLEVVDCGTVGEPVRNDGWEHQVLSCQVAQGTQNFTKQPAMTKEQCQQALIIGKESVERAVACGADIYVAGEMGIGNTCSASALACLLLGERAETMTGRGTGVDDETLNRKTDVVHQAIQKYQGNPDPLMSLASVGGFEMVAMVGAYIRAGQLGVPVVVDGFITSVSALTATRINPTIAPWLLYGHRSAELAHGRVLDALGAVPLLDLGLRLGEASGAVASLSLIRLACEVHDKMATFSEAGVST